MLRFDEKFSPRQQFWIGFLCCPLITWSALATFIFLLAQTQKFWGSSPSHLTALATGFLVVTGLIFSVGTPVFAGVAAALFWRHFKSVHGDKELAGFWSITLTWSPMLVFLLIFSGEVFFFFFLPFMIFTLLYSSGLRRGLVFWSSPRGRQWFGDFSELESTGSSGQ